MIYEEEEDFGQIGPATKVGVVTFVDEKYNYVWSNSFGHRELRYPLNPDVSFEAGEVVRFMQTHDGRGVQIMDKLTKIKPTDPLMAMIPFEIDHPTNSKKVKWRYRLPVVFSPPTWNRKLVATDSLQQEVHTQNRVNLHAFAYNPEFKEIALLAGLEFQPNVPYYAYITRIPFNLRPYVYALQTIWLISMKQHELTPIEDPEKAKEVFESAPWNAHLRAIEMPAIGLLSMSSSSDEEQEDEEENDAFTDDEEDEEDNKAANEDSDGSDEPTNIPMDPKHVQTIPPEISEQIQKAALERERKEQLQRLLNQQANSISSSSKVAFNNDKDDVTIPKTNATAENFSSDDEEEPPSVQTNLKDVPTIPPEISEQLQKEAEERERKAKMQQILQEQSIPSTSQAIFSQSDPNSYAPPPKLTDEEFREFMLEQMEPPKKEGIVIFKEDHYIAVWNREEGLVRAQGYGRKSQLRLDESFELGTFVFYRSFEENSDLKNGFRSKYIAYSLEKSKKRDIQSVIRCDTVTLEVKVENIRKLSKEYNVGDHPWLCTILVPGPNDPVVERATTNGEPLWVLAMFMETDPKVLNWVAYAHRDSSSQDNGFFLFEELPPEVDLKAVEIFNEASEGVQPPKSKPDPSKKGNDSKNKLPTSSPTGKLAEQKAPLKPTSEKFAFMPPYDWSGEKYVMDGSIGEVLGIVVGHLPGPLTLISTPFGHAYENSEPEKLPLGMWVKIWMKPIDDEDDEEELRKNESDSTQKRKFTVLKREKIGPLMSTRVVKHKRLNKDKDQIQRVLLCCAIDVSDLNNPWNEYLDQNLILRGKLPDFRKLPSKERTAVKKHGALCELLLTNPENPELSKWNIVKYHGSGDLTTTIAMMDSFCTTDMGETRDSKQEINSDRYWRNAALISIEQEREYLLAIQAANNENNENDEEEAEQTQEQIYDEDFRGTQQSSPLPPENPPPDFWRYSGPMQRQQRDSRTRPSTGTSSTTTQYPMLGNSRQDLTGEEERRSGSLFNPSNPNTWDAPAKNNGLGGLSNNQQQSNSTPSFCNMMMNHMLEKEERNGYGTEIRPKIRKPLNNNLYETSEEEEERKNTNATFSVFKKL